jgi:hypothetical protein
MKKIIRIFALLLITLTFAHYAAAHLKTGILSNEEASQLLLKQNKTDDDYEKLGEWWMEKMLGSSQHETMDKAMTESMGEEFLHNMHIAMGKHFTEGRSLGMMPMMQMFYTGRKDAQNNWLPMMGWGMMDNFSTNRWMNIFSFAGISLFLWFIALPLALTILAIVFAVKLWKQIKK